MHNDTCSSVNFLFMKNKCLLITALFFIVLLISCNGQKSKADNSIVSFITERADSLYRAEKVPGIFIGVSDNGKRQYYTVGYADPDKKMPFDSATLFEIGSITKTFTAYVLEAVLKEKGISDSGSILNYLPDSVRQNKALEPISFLSLLNHTSGLPRLPDNMDLSSNPMQPYADYDVNHFFSYLKTCTPVPNGKSNYSNLGVGLAGVLAERISGKSYSALLDEYIFSPFGLGKADKPIGEIKNKSQGYFQNNKSAYWDMNVLSPAGGLKCAGNELLTYLECINNPVSNDSRQIIDKLLQPTVAITPAIKVARAWHTMERENKPVVYWHNGGTYGFSTYAAFVKGKNKAVVVVINQFNKNAISDDLGRTIMSKLAE